MATASNDDANDLIDRIVAIHGEGGLCPTRRDWSAILGRSRDAPIEVLNLLKFRDEIQTPEGTCTGADAYAKYSESVASAFARAGAVVLYFGAVAHAFGTVADARWDAVVLSRYPTPGALAEFWLDAEFVAAHTNRIDGVEESRVLVLGTTLRRRSTLSA